MVLTCSKKNCICPKKGNNKICWKWCFHTDLFQKLKLFILSRQLQGAICDAPLQYWHIEIATDAFQFIHFAPQDRIALVQLLWVFSIRGIFTSFCLFALVLVLKCVFSVFIIFIVDLLVCLFVCNNILLFDFQWHETPAAQHSTES